MRTARVVTQAAATRTAMARALPRCRPAWEPAQFALGAWPKENPMPTLACAEPW